MSIKQAFDRCAEDYDLTRKQLIPCFDDFYGTALEIIPFSSDAGLNVLDLGAGTGLFSSLVAQVFPNAGFTLYDISDQMLEQAKKRFSKSRVKVDYVVRDYAKDPIDGKFDLVISALSVHHLTIPEKQTLFEKIYASLNKDGLFINADQVLGESPFIDEMYRSTWTKQVREKGAAEEMLDAAFDRMKEDKMSTLSDQLEWLRNAGFSEVNSWYQNFSFAVFSGNKKEAR